MKTNIGTTDRVIRIVVSIVLAGLYAVGVLSGTIGMVALIIAALLFATALVGWCGLYALLGINTGCCSSSEAASSCCCCGGDKPSGDTPEKK